jgi:hypothetical protein
MPVGPPPVWAPPRRRPPGVTVALVSIALFIVIAAIAMASVVGVGEGSGGIAFEFLGIIAFMVVAIAFVAIAAAGGFRRPSLPPPPPIQRPMVPAGTQGPVALDCPNCGAPPQSVDRFGVAMCTYCGTRFIVR